MNLFLFLFQDRYCYFEDEYVQAEVRQSMNKDSYFVLSILDLQNHRHCAFVVMYLDQAISSRKIQLSQLSNNFVQLVIIDVIELSQKTDAIFSSTNNQQSILLFSQISDQDKLIVYYSHYFFMMQEEIIQVDTVLRIVIVAGFGFVAYSLLGFFGMIAMAITLTSLSILVYLKWRRFRERGLISFLRQKLRTNLLQRSILDIFRDIVYFPYVTKIIGVVVTIATTKPHPDRIPDILKSLPSQVYEAATKKGLLSLAPSAVQSLILPEINKELLPAHYGRSQSQWDRIQEYHKSQQLVHEQTLEKRAIVFLDSKFGWLSIVVMIGGVLAGAHQMNPKKFKRMIIQNTTFCCLVLSLIALIIKIRRQTHKKKRNDSQAIQAAVKA